MQHAMVSLQDVERIIRDFEQEYGITSDEFLKGAPAVSEDDGLKWDTYLDFRRRHQEIHRELRNEYVGYVRSEGGSSSEAVNNQL